MIRLLVLVLSLSFFSPIYADDKDKPPKISPWLYKKLTQSEQLIAKKQYPQAEQKLKSILSKVKDKSYEKAIVLRSLSSVYALKGQYKKATSNLDRAIKQRTLPQKQLEQAILSLGQLYMATEQYQKAIQTLTPWLANHNTSDPQINILIANAYAQLKKYRQALPFVKKAIRNTKKPEESWYQLNLAIYYELENYSSAAKLLTKLIKRYPEKKDYWNQLSSIYQQTRQYKKAASISHLAYKKGILSSQKEILALSNLFLYIKSPYQAARLISKEISNKRLASNSKNWELLAHAWTMAKEFNQAIKALETASKFNNKGSLDQQIGQIYVEQEKWSQAIKYLTKAIRKGHLKNTGDTYLLLGMCHYELHHLGAARKAFLKAAQYSKNKKVARQWLNYIKESNK